MVQITDLVTGNYWKHMGMTTLPDVDGKIQVVMKVTENLKQFYGNVNGGVIAGLLDKRLLNGLKNGHIPIKGPALDLQHPWIMNI